MPLIRWCGRTGQTQHGAMFYHIGSGFDLLVEGRDLQITLWSSYPEDRKKAHIKIDIMKHETVISSDIHVLEEGTQTIRYQFETDGTYHVKLRRRSEAMMSKVALLDVGTSGAFLECLPEKKRLKIEFIGDSTTCGYGNLGALEQPFSTACEDGLNTYAVLAAEALDAKYLITCYSGIGMYKSLYASTTMPSAYEMADLDSNVPIHLDFDADVIVLNMGTNDHTYLDHLIEQSRVHEQQRFKEVYTDFVRRLLAMNQHAIILAITQDQRQAHVEDAIKDAVKDMRHQRVRHESFSAITPAEGIGSQYHPSLLTHQKWAKELIAIIDTLSLKRT